MVTTAPFILRPYQLEAIERIRELVRQGRRRIILAMETGSGKCLGLGTPVLCYNGAVLPAELVQPGDTLMGPDGQPRHVLSTCRGRGPLYRIIPVKGEPWVCNDVHVLTLKHTVTGAVEDVPLNEYLPETKGWKHKRKLFSTGVDFPQAEPLALPPYFVGLWIGDGTKKLDCVEISKPDREVYQACCEMAELFGLKVRVKAQPGKCPTYVITAGQRGGAENRLLTIMRGEFRNGTIPHRYLVSNRANRLDLLAGIFDSDGYLCNGGYEVCQKNSRYADAIAFLARSLGLRVTRSIKTVVGQDYHKLSISGETSTVPCRIPRKRAAPRRQKKDPLRTGFSVEAIGDGEYAGFELDGDGRFLLGDFTVTHNTPTACGLIQLTVAKGNTALFLAGARELVRQASDKLWEFGVLHGVIMAGRGQTPAPVQVASKDTLSSRALRRQRLALPPADLVVVDECDIALGENWRKLLAHYPHAVVLGMSATPVRSDGYGMGDYYQAMVQVVKRSELIRGGFIVPTETYAPYVPNLKPKKGEKAYKSDGDYRGEFLDKRMDRPRIVGDIVRWWKKLGQNRPTAFFACSVANSRHVAQEFNNAGITAAHLDAESDESYREEILGTRHHEGALAAGTVKVACNYGVLVAGIDIPALGCIIMGRPTNSIRVHRQAVGRGVRPYPGPLYMKTKAIFLDHSGNCYHHGLPDDDIEWELSSSVKIDDKLKKEKKDRPERDPLECPSCGLVFKGPHCPGCGYEPPKRSAPQVDKDGALVRVSAADVATLPPAALAGLKKLWHRSLAVSAARDLTPQSAAVQFKEKTGLFPWQVPGLPNVPAPGEPWRQKTRTLYPGYWKG